MVVSFMTDNYQNIDDITAQYRRYCFTGDGNDVGNSQRRQRRHGHRIRAYRRARVGRRDRRIDLHGQLTEIHVSGRFERSFKRRQRLI